jgi:hypothetical protein
MDQEKEKTYLAKAELAQMGRAAKAAASAALASRRKAGGAASAAAAASRRAAERDGAVPMLLGEPAGGTLLDSVPMPRARERQQLSALRVLSAFRARKRDGEKPLLQVSPPYVPTWVEPTLRVSEVVEPLPRSAWLPRVPTA